MARTGAEHGWDGEELWNPAPSSTLAGMPELPGVSVVVPVYNGSSTIADCLHSLFALRYPQEKLEIVVVDNASTDTTADILECYADRIRIAREEKRGPAAARNRGIVAARHDVVACTDADCIVHADWLRNIVGPLTDLQVGIVGGRILSRLPCNGIERFGETIHDHRKAIQVFTPPYVITMNWASRRRVLEEVGLFDVRLIRCEDVDLSWRLLQARYELRYAPGAIVYHKNEETLRGLFREGYLHGLWGVQVLKIQKDFVRQLGHRRCDWRSYRRLAPSCSRSPSETRCGPGTCSDSPCS